MPDSISRFQQLLRTRVNRTAAAGFEAAPEAYERGRPEYPADAVEFLVRELGLGPSRAVVDLGAGTGKLTRLLVPSGARIVAVEPVLGMRRKFTTVLPDVELLEGSAEAIPLEQASVDAVVVAQAFHWFDGRSALREINRVLKPGGKLALIWNARDDSVEWVRELDAIVDEADTGVPRYKTRAWSAAFQDDSLFSPLEERQFTFKQVAPPDVYVDRVASISYIAAMTQDRREKVLEKVRLLLATHPQTAGLNEITLPYRTDVYWCRR